MESMLTKCDFCDKEAECELWPWRSVLVSLCKKCSDVLIAEHEAMKKAENKKTYSTNTKMELDIKKTDTLFYDSPDVGDPLCMCSRCGERIPKEQSPILRAWPQTREEAFGRDPNKLGKGSEYRFCWKCSRELGIDFKG